MDSREAEVDSKVSSNTSLYSRLKAFNHLTDGEIRIQVILYHN